MNDYTFTLRFLSPIEDLDELSILLYDQMVDASLSGPDDDGSFLLEFDKRASSLPRALTSAIEELLKVLPQAQILRVEEETFIFQLHVTVVWLLFAFWPFSRLVHAWSVPVDYLRRSPVVYRSRVGRPLRARRPADVAAARIESGRR